MSDRRDLAIHENQITLSLNALLAPDPPFAVRTAGTAVLADIVKSQGNVVVADLRSASEWARHA